MRSLLLLPCLAAALLAAAAPASAAPTWLSPVTVSPSRSGDVTGATIASDDAGHVVAAWLRDDTAPGVTYSVDVSLRSPGGGFTPAATLSPAGVGADPPSVGIDASGTATVVWAEADTSVKAIRIAPDGTRSAIETVAAGAADAPRVAVAPSGAAVLVWVDGGQVVAGTRAGPAGEFSAGTPISAAGGVSPESLRVAIDAAGDAVAAWRRADTVEANRRPAGGAFDPPAGASTLSGNGATGSLALALAPDGRATALWEYTGQIIQTANRTIAPSFAGGTWSGATQASPPGSTALTPSLALDAQNTAIAVWLAQAPMSSPVVQAATRLSGASFTNYQPLSGGGTGFASQVDVAPDGAAVAIWIGLSGARPAVQAARRAPGSPFGAVTDITLGNAVSDPSESLFGATLAVDDQGNAAAIWSRFRQTNPPPGAINDWRVEAAGFDAAPPTLTAVSVPSSASVGAGVGFAAAATDRWTGSSISWSFGDGATAPGDAVTHAFGRAGAFTVTASAADGVGNVAAAQRQILISDTRPRRIDATVQSKWGFSQQRKKRFYLFRLRVVAPPKGSAVQVRCAGKGCRFQSRRFTKRRRNAITPYKLVGAKKVVKQKRRRFRAGQTVQVRITAPGFVGKVVKWKLKKGRQPVGKVLCLPEGANRPRKC